MDAACEEAVKRGDVSTVRALLAQGTDMDARDHYGQTALMLAAHAGHREIANLEIANLLAEQEARVGNTK